jgi:hypothetical protein
MSKPRHARQVRLAEIGEEGQARIYEATARVSAEGLAATVQARYVAGAGFKAIATAHPIVASAARAVDREVEIVDGAKGEAAEGEPPAFGIKDPVALEVALGAWRALVQVRRAALHDGEKRA